MSYSTETTNRIERLHSEALAAGDEAQAELCEEALAQQGLYSGDDNDPVHLEDLDCTTVEYVDAIIRSLHDSGDTGLTYVGGRYVYAM